MKVTDLLAPEDVLFLPAAADKNQVIRQLAGRAADRSGLDAQALARDLLRREELGSTGMGSGIALPHARIPSVQRPVAILARLDRPIAFDSVDGQPVDVVFLLILPDHEAALQALATAARMLRDGQVLADVRHARSAADVLMALEQD
jgi:PTS system nitrogen regulatory IIA component